MATVIDELMITLGVDGKQAAKGINDATRQIKGGLKSMTSGISDALGGITSKLGAVGAAFASMYGMQQAFSSYLATADELGKFSDSIGQNIEDIHAWSEAVIRSGGSAEGFKGSIKSLTTQLSKMSTTGRSRAGSILQSVGIDAGEIGRQRNALDVMLEISDKMQGMSKEEAFGFGSSLGLDSGTIMMLQQGKDAVKDLIQNQKELGVYTKEDAKVTAEYNDAVADTKQAFMSFASIIFRMVVPGMKQVVKWATEFITFLRKHETAVKAFFIMIAALITGLLLPAMASFFATLLANPITWVVMLLAALALAIEDLIVWSEGGESALGDLWAAIFGSPEEAKQVFEDIKQALSDIWDVVKPLGKAFLEFYKSMDLKDKALFNIFPVISIAKIGLEEFINWINAKMSELAQWISDQFTAMGEWINSVWQSISNTAGAVVGGIIGFFANLRDNIIALIGEAIDWAIGKLAELAAAVKATPIIGGAVSVIGSAYDAVVGGGGGTTNNSTSETRIGTINVQTQATDANGIARDIGGATKRYSAAQANGGTW